MRLPGKHFHGLGKNEVHFQANWNLALKRMAVHINFEGKKVEELMTPERYESFCDNLKQDKFVVADMTVNLEGGDKSQIYNYFFQVLEGYKAAKAKGLI